MISNLRQNISALVGLAIILLTALIAPQRAHAQTDAQFSQYFQVPNYYNAGAIGTSDLLNVRVGTRMQWLGIHGAPRTFLITGEMPFRLFNKRFGVGLVMQQESLGLYKNINVGAQAAYRQKLKKSYLSIGVQVGFFNQSFKGSEVYLPDDDDYHQSSDEGIPMQDITGNSLDLSAGIFYTHPKFRVGISGTHLNSPSVKLNAESGENAEEKNYEFQIGRTLYFIAESNIPVKNTLFEVMPSVLFKTDLTFYSWDATLRGRYNKFLTFGVGYRWEDAVYAVVAAELKGFYIGASYDYPMSAISKASSGSLEVFVGYSMKLDFSDKNRNRHRSIRIM